jgi:hypothetical protein
MNHPVTWQTPQPLWSRFGATSAEGATAPDQAQPAILRFDSDEFMEQMLAALDRDPASLGERIARPETWRLPMGSSADLIERMPVPRLAKTLARIRVDKVPRTAVAPSTSVVAVKENEVARQLPLKLYQPAHQRYYLLAANLVCAVPGLPERALATGGSEQVGFVLRRMLPPVPAIAGVDRVEHAFVKDAGGARWQRVGEASKELVPGEELLPLFSMGFAAERGRARRMHAGVVPVGRREEYMSTRAQSAASGDAGVAATPSPVAARKEQFKLDVSEPWKNIVRTAVYARARIVDPGDGSGTDAQRTDQATRTNQQLAGQSWLVLLDFADYLATHLPKVWECVETPALGASLTGTPKALFDWVNGNETRPTAAWTGIALSNITLREALKRIRAARASLEGATALYPDAPGAGLAWPDFTYLLAGVRGAGVVYDADGLQVSLAAKTVTADVKDLDALTPNLTPEQAQAEAAAAAIDKLVQMVITAIDLDAPAQPAPPLPFAARLRDAYATTQGDEGWFVMRCAYVRCDCGPLRPTVLSAPTSRFQLASFFDPDAPARPIRIALPLDTTPAGLRKHNKNAAFVMSDVLCGQVQRAKGLGFVDLVRSVLPWPLHKDLDVGGMGPCQQSSPQASLGMICSLSLPIITICALIMLMIIVSLLDFIFRWMPYFVMCFPVPKLKGKGDST